ncbi:hypothetical protein ACROYT_G020369 [Oculina patagonica]
MFSKSDHGRHKPWAALGAWFMGPKAENGDVFHDLVTQTIDSQIKFRRHVYFPCDPPYVTDELREADAFKASMDHLKKEMEVLQKKMMNSVPFYSSRYKGHVNWDVAMPAHLGYMCALLYNQNNCAAEASTVTTSFELEVGTDLCVMMGFDRDKSMGHLVTGGSVANIEAIWAARNVKFFPLALQRALTKEKELAAAKHYKVFFPQRGKKGELTSGSEWELLNLETASILDMPTDVEKMTGLEHTEFMDIMSDYLYESIGAPEFARRHPLIEKSCVVVPSTSHISFTKAVTILGLGRNNLIPVAVDEDSRMDAKVLRDTLEKHLEKQIPVVTVVAVMGTTEESAIDPLTEILKIRKDFSKKGLDFSIHADGAWGGYFCSMLRDQPKNHYLKPPEDSGFVPQMYLSSYVHDQLSALGHCDTITIDPHKSGFCPYPAGALCYKDKQMNTFLQITTSVVYYHGDMTLGDIGIEGSKPGAAAASVLLANRVIGLHKNGYGRILSECTYTAKMLYCLWLTLPEEDDQFIIETTKPLPPKWNNMSEKEQIKFIRERIIGKTNEELAKDHEAMTYLTEIGPDTLVPCFTVNLKGNKSVDVCNQINMAIFQDLSHSTGDTTAHRIPMIVTASSMLHHKHSSALKSFKKRLGLDHKDESPVKFIITTCMDPWATSVDFLDDLASIMRNSILCAIGTVKDPKCHHDFVSTGVVNSEHELIVYYAGNFKNVSKQYGTVATLKFNSESQANEYTTKQDALTRTSTDPQPIVFRSKAKTTLHDVFFGESEYGDQQELFDCYVGMPSHGSKPFMSANMKVFDVPQYEHFDDDEYPESSSYFMYGDKKDAFLFHIPTKNPDFLQIVQLDGIPNGVGTEDDKDLLLKKGIEVNIPDISGSPTMAGGEVQDPLKKKNYDITFVGIDGEEVKTKVKLGRKIWFDGTKINK